MQKVYNLYDDEKGKVEYIQHMGDDLTIVNAARVSFGKEKKEIDNRDRKLIKYLIDHRHTSTLEHNCVTFRFTVPLFVRAQHHRHRTWSYNEISRRYTEIDLEFYEPKTFRTQHKSNRQASNLDMINPVIWPDLADPDYGTPASVAIQEHHLRSIQLFHRLLSQGVCREQARGVLPQNMYTQYYGSVNLNNLIKFISLRTHDGAQWEIQKVAEACHSIATDLWPNAMKHFKLSNSE